MTATHYHRVFKDTGGGFFEFVATFPVQQEDPNQGLPDWYFEGPPMYIAFEVDTAKDQIEWVPEMGPAPIWKATLSSFKSDQDMLQTWDTWVKKTY